MEIVKPSSPVKPPYRIGLAVVFASLAEKEKSAIEQIWQSASSFSNNWTPAFYYFGINPLPGNPDEVDLLVYLGESSRFGIVAQNYSQKKPVVFIKSTVEELLNTPPGYEKRYRMSTGVNGIAQALASVAPVAPTVDWATLPWPENLKNSLHLDDAELNYMERSISAFRKAGEERGISWQTGLPGEGPFSVFLTMHDPIAATLADAALKLWPQCTPIAADGMSSTHAPDGTAWPERLIRIRHWTANSQSESNNYYQSLTGGKSIPDFDSPGMLFGTMYYLEKVFSKGVKPSELENAGICPGPLGLMQMTLTGKPSPERVVIFHGEHWEVVEIN